jgi:hypothetical protein
LAALGNSYAQLDAAGIRPPTHSLPPERLGWLKSLERRLKGTERFAKISSRPSSHWPEKSSAVGTVQAKNQPAQK